MSCKLRQVAVLGVTGAVGTSTLDVIAGHFLMAVSRGLSWQWVALAQSCPLRLVEYTLEQTKEVEPRSLSVVEPFDNYARAVAKDWLAVHQRKV